MELPPLILPNTGNMGVPICLFAYGTSGLGVASAIASVIILLHFTIGVLLAKKSFSMKILITNINSRIPVRIGKKNYKAIVVGNPKSERQLNLEFLPKEYTFENGDIIYTTSIENIMPDGILVGQIKLRDNKNFEAKPLYDFSQLDYVTVVKFVK